MATSMFDATVSILLTGKRSTPMSAPTTVAVSLEVDWFLINQFLGEFQLEFTINPDLL